MTTERECGSCTLCCKVMSIEEIDKPAGAWCPHCVIGKGCGTYEERPESCRVFMCHWLVDPTMPDTMRPDRTKVVVFVQPGSQRMVARCDPATPLAWMKEPFYSGLKQMARKAAAEGRVVMAYAGRRNWVIGPNEDLDLGELDPRCPIKVRYLPGGRVSAEVLPPE